MSVVLQGAKLGVPGSGLGQDGLIVQLSRVAGASLQLSAFATGVLLVYLGLGALRTARTPYLGILVALLGSGPTAILFLAQKYELNQDLGFLAVVLSAFTLCVCAHQVRSKRGVRRILALAGITLLCVSARVVLERTAPANPWGKSLGALEHILRWSLLGFIALRHLKDGRRLVLSRAAVLFVPVLLASTVSLSDEVSHSGLWLVIGRSLSALTPNAELGALGCFGFAAALTFAFAALSDRTSSAQLQCALIGLGVFSATSPLACAWLTCSGFALLLICCVTREDFSAPLSSNRQELSA